MSRRKGKPKKTIELTLGMDELEALDQIVNNYSSETQTRWSRQTVLKLLLKDEHLRVFNPEDSDHGSLLKRLNLYERRDRWLRDRPPGNRRIEQEVMGGGGIHLTARDVWKLGPSVTSNPERFVGDGVDDSYEGALERLLRKLENIDATDSDAETNGQNTDAD